LLKNGNALELISNPVIRLIAQAFQTAVANLMFIASGRWSGRNRVGPPAGPVNGYYRLLFEVP